MTVKIIKGLLSPEKLKLIDDSLNEICWEDGVKTAHGVAKDIKKNNQCIKPSPELNVINRVILDSVKENKNIQNTILPIDILYPMLNKHSEGYYYGKHIDRPLRYKPKQDSYFRCDCSMTVFLSDKDSYEGGELVLYDNDAVHKIKLDKGDAVIYPTNFIHEVKEVKSGQRICAVTWIQSAIRDNYERSIVADAYHLTHVVAKLTRDPEANALASKVWSNLNRKWGL